MLQIYNIHEIHVTNLQHSQNLHCKFMTLTNFKLGIYNFQKICIMNSHHSQNSCNEFTTFTNSLYDEFPNFTKDPLQIYNIHKFPMLQLYSLHKICIKNFNLSQNSCYKSTTFVNFAKFLLQIIIFFKIGLNF